MVPYLKLVLVYTVAFGEHKNFPCIKLIDIVILWVYYTIPFGFVHFGTFWSLLFNFSNYIFGSGSLMRFQYPKCAYGPYR